MKTGKWTESEIATLKKLTNERKYLWIEIAKKMNRKNTSVTNMVRKLGLRGGAVVLGRVGEKNRKYSLKLVEQVMTYFMKHSHAETAKQFNLTERQLKNLMTNAYMFRRFTHLRKETRTHATFGEKEYLFMAKHAGIMPHIWIAKTMKRGSTHHVVKDRLRGIGSRYLNGLTLPLAEELLPGIQLKFFVTKAGSPGPHGKMFTRIVPWVFLEKAIVGKKIDPLIRDGIKAMAKYQKWIHQSESSVGVMKKIGNILEKV